MVTKNTFDKGINQDLSKLKTPQNNYLEGGNITITTDDGSSSYAVKNTKGTLLNFSLPETLYKVFSLDFDGVTGTVNFTFDIDGDVTVIAINNIELLSNESIVNQLNTALNTDDVVAYFNESNVIIYGYVPLDLSIDTTGLTLLVDEYSPYIIGWGYSNNYLVLLTTDLANSNLQPETVVNSAGTLGTFGSIWLIPINRETNQAIKKDGSLIPIGDELTPFDFLVYSNILNFSRQYAIYKEVKCRYEDSETFTIAFTDFYNDLRLANLFQEQIQAIPIETLSVLPSVTHKQPYIEELIEGSTLPVGSYQYFYQLYTRQGAKTTISPLTAPYVLTRGIPTNFDQYNAYAPGTESGKSLKITIDDIDNNYDIIRVGYVIYQVANVPEIFFFEERELNNETNLSFIHNGNENDIPLSDITELSNVNKPPTIFKSIDVVRNYLLAANAKSKIFDVEFDARAYRWDTNSFVDLYKASDSFPTPEISLDTSGLTADLTIDGVTTSYLTLTEALENIPENRDLINPFNNEDNTDTLNGGNWLANSQYQYQSDLITIGGEGLNIKYKFITSNQVADLNNTTTNIGIGVQPNIYNQEAQFFDNSPNPKFIGGSFSSMKSAANYHLFKGYARGEVYRFGIVFIDKYGYPSPAHWIGDIKFPFAHQYELLVNGLETSQLGIEFEIDYNSPQWLALKDKISGYYFVRMERTESDATKLGIGFISLANRRNTLTGRYYRKAAPTLPTGFIEDSTVALFDRPNNHFNVFNPQSTNNDYIKGIANYSSVLVQQNINSKVYRLEKHILTPAYTNLHPRTNILGRFRVDRPSGASLQESVPSLGLNNQFINMAPFDSAGADSNEYRFTGHAVELLTASSGNFISDGGVGSVNIASYERYNPAQYGGRGLQFRYDNKYIPCYYAPVDFNGTHKVWGGDAIVNLYDYQMAEINFEQDTGYVRDNNSNPTNFDLGVAILFPAESHHLNPEYRIRETQLPARRIGEDFIYNERYNVPNLAYYQENNSTLFFSKALNQKEIIEQPFSIYASSPKIDGETINSWRFFKVNDFISLNGNFGPINKIIEFKDRLFAFQNSSVSQVAINERVVISEGETSQTQLGTGTLLQRYDPVTTESGAFHQFAVCKSGQALYYYDAFNKKILYLSQDAESFSDALGLRGFLNQLPDSFKVQDKLLLNSSVGVHCEFDSQQNKVYFTFRNFTESSNKSKTIVFNELQRCFESTDEAFKPNMYLSMEDRFISSNPTLNNTIYTHNKGLKNVYYGVLSPSYITIRVNENSDFVKTFDNFEFNTEVIQNLLSLQESISSLSMSNDYQSSGVIPLTPNVNFTPRLRKWRYNNIRSNSSTYGFRDRMRDKYLDVKISFNQSDINDNKDFILHDVITEYSMRSTIKPNQDA